LLALLFLWVLAYLGTAVYLFPVMVQFRTGWWQVIKNSFFIAFSRPGLVPTFLCFLIVALAGLVLYYVPLSFLITGSVTAYLIYNLCHRVFGQLPY
jgi:uncharacterized membrane protein YesL